MIKRTSQFLLVLGMQNKQRKIFQLTGLSGAGKTTLASGVKERLGEQGYKIEVLDGDEIRKTLSADLGFTRSDRLEHLRRLAGIANTIEADVILIAVINPYAESRSFFRESCNAGLIWNRCNLAVLRQRDTKGLYQKAFLPEDHPAKLRNLTGVNDVFEEPSDADLIIDTDKTGIEESVRQICNYIGSEYGRATENAVSSDHGLKT